MSRFQLQVLGTRGSMAVGGSEKDGFGGATSCYMVQAGGQTVFLDGGSGLLDAPVEFDVPPAIVLTHLHLDHVLGLGMYPRLSQKGLQTDLYVPAEDAAGALAALDGLYSPPFWPLSLKDYAGDVRIRPLTLPLQLGDMRIEGMEGCHPGGCFVLKLLYEGRSLVLATDFEHEEPFFSELAAFAKDADLLLYDGQYTEAEYGSRRGFGHSTAAKGVELMDRCGAKRLLLIHHDPSRTDAQLASMGAAIGRETVRFARAGETIAL